MSRCANEVGDALFTLQGSNAGVAGRQRCQIRRQVKVSDLMHLKYPSSPDLGIISENQRGPVREFGGRNPMRCDVDDLKIGIGWA